jgi:hypothetical protein
MTPADPAEARTLRFESKHKNAAVPIPPGGHWIIEEDGNLHVYDVDDDRVAMFLGPIYAAWLVGS